jgi:hypothetical protein
MNSGYALHGHAFRLKQRDQRRPIVNFSTWSSQANIGVDQY